MITEGLDKYLDKECRALIRKPSPIFSNEFKWNKSNEKNCLFRAEEKFTGLIYENMLQCAPLMLNFSIP